jgi:hypothetical protein
MMVLERHDPIVGKSDKRVMPNKYAGTDDDHQLGIS